MLDLGFVFAFSNLYALSAALRDLVIDQLDPGFNGLCGGALKVRVQRGVNAVSLLVYFALRYLADDGVADEIDEIGSVAGFDVGWR